MVPRSPQSGWSLKIEEGGKTHFLFQESRTLVSYGKCHRTSVEGTKLRSGYACALGTSEADVADVDGVDSQAGASAHTITLNEEIFSFFAKNGSCSNGFVHGLKNI